MRFSSYLRLCPFPEFMTALGHSDSFIANCGYRLSRVGRTSRNGLHLPCIPATYVLRCLFMPAGELLNTATLAGVDNSAHTIGKGLQPPKALVLLYGFAVTLSAILLFLIEPMIAKQLLPSFGGAAAVWATCLMFFQCVLLLGYTYAHGLQRLQARNQALVHGLLLIAAAGFLFLPAQTATAIHNPVLACLYLLSTHIGLPFFVLSTTSPLLQSWYAVEAQRGRTYRLFAVSNFGALLALIAYPVGIERFLTLSSQFAIWRSTYCSYVAVCLCLAPLMAHRKAKTVPYKDRRISDTRPLAVIEWTALAACSSALLIGVTNLLCQNIAPIPLIWVAPLAVYLATFALCFNYERFFYRPAFKILTPIALLGLLWLDAESGLKIKAAVPVALISLFVIFSFCHGQLVKLKPGVDRLTSFYLWLSVGGALGGIFVALLAPAVFTSLFEVKIAIAICFVLTFRFLYRSWIFLTVITAVLLAFFGIREKISASQYQDRNFYGLVSVFQFRDAAGEPVRALAHGTVVHGEQFLGRHHAEPTTYYGRNSGVGLLLNIPGPPRRVGVVGLGTGTLAAYARLGDIYRFYEINPLVTSIATSRFTFLQNSPAQTTVAAGDARLTLAKERGQTKFDDLVLDAFNGDSIPVHLLTAEAFAEYSRHLTSAGIIAVHVSNNYLDLVPVVARLSAELKKSAVLVRSEGEPKRQIGPAKWVLVGEKPLLETIVRGTRVTFLQPSRERLWTDEYSNLFAILKY